MRSGAPIPNLWLSAKLRLGPQVWAHICEQIPLWDFKISSPFPPSRSVGGVEHPRRGPAADWGRSDGRRRENENHMGPDSPPASFESSVLENNPTLLNGYPFELCNHLKWLCPTVPWVIACRAQPWSKGQMDQVLISKWGTWEELPVLVPITCQDGFPSGVFPELLICEPGPCPDPNLLWEQTSRTGGLYVSRKDPGVHGGGGELRGGRVLARLVGEDLGEECYLTKRMMARIYLAPVMCQALLSNI